MPLSRRYALPLSGLLALALVAGEAPKHAPRTAHAAPAAKALPAPVKVTSVEGITEYDLANGLKVLLFPDASKPTTTVNITYLVGSRNETYGETGMAHLLEHLMFKPSRKFSGKDGHPNPVEVLNSVGARFNGSTSYDRTNYFVTFPAGDANLDKILDLESDRMVHANIDGRDLWDPVAKKGEMTVVRNEFEMGENNPINVTLERTLAKAFDWQNYGKSTIGARSDIEHVNIERLQAFYRTYYQPDNAVLLVAGKFEPAKTLAKINDLFGAIPRPTRTIQTTYTLDPVQDGERSVTVRRVGDIQAVLAAYKVSAGSDPDGAALDVLSHIMTDAPSGRLYKALVEAKKAAMVFPYYGETKEPGFLLFGAAVPKDANLAEARGTMLKVLEDTKAQPFTQQEVDRAKAALLKNFDLVMNQSDRLGISLSEYIAQGDWRLFFLNRDRVKAVTPAQVDAVAANYLKESNRTVGEFIPTAKPDRTEIPAVKDVEAMLKGYQGQAVVAQGEAFDATPANIDARTQTFTTASGLKTAILAKKTRGETVSATLVLHLGSEQALMGKGAAPELTGAMLMRGTTKHTRQELKDAFDKLKAQVFVMGDAENARVMITTERKAFPEVMQLVAEVLQHPAFPASELETLVKEQVTGLEYQKSEPQFQATQALRQHFDAQYPKGHPRHADNVDESLADLKAAKVEDLKAFHDAFYGAGAGDLAIVGDVDPAATKQLVEELFGAWKAPVAFARIPSAYVPVKPVEEKLETPDKANAFYVSGLTMPLADTDPDYPALLLGNYMLGGGALRSRLADRIRQKDGLSYGVGSQLSAQSQDAKATWNAFAIYNPANLAKLEVAFKEEIARALDKGFTEQEIQDAKTAWLQGQASSRAQDRELAGRLASNLYLGRTMAWQADLERKVQALTNDQILAALHKHFDPSKISVFVAGDFAKADKK
ncbi:peptidase M16 [Geothrix rubra]|uniref:Peptidase M16 n=1 Tax=Geothrix rubra TaxID=2927977 RepID=A0ABQ5Q824_9BACT|nr:pitrilysin family protein [Geothrix rubra]GLH70573.1 peptidase M16 [Geothrix rubra]